MKVITILMLVVWFDEVPGGWTYFKEMALRLSDAGFNICVISPRIKGNKQIEKIGNVTIYRCSSLYVSQIPLLIVNPFDFFSALKMIFLREKQIDLVYDTTSGLLPLSLMAKFFFRLKCINIPLVVHVHGELKDFKSKSFLSLVFELYFHSITTISFAFAEKILLAGERIVPRVLSLGISPVKLRIIKLGLKYENKLQSFSNKLSAEEKRKLVSSIGLQEKDFVVGYVGRLSVGKNLDVLLYAVSIIKNNIPNLKLLLVGDGSEKANLNLIVSSLSITNISIFLGQREDVLSLLQLMDVFVNLSSSEAGMSATQIEAMTMNIPSVITPFTDIIENMKEAIVVPFEDAQAVADAIMLLYINKEIRNSIITNGSIKAQELLNSYSWDNYVKRVKQVFERLLVHKVES